MTIGEYIKDYREKMGLSQRKFAEKCNLSNAFISMLEKGENPKTKKPMELSIQNYKAIASATGITVDNLFEILGPDAPVKIEKTERQGRGIIDLLAGAPHPFHPSVMDQLRTRPDPTPKEDAEMALLWQTASIQAKRAAIAVLKSMKEADYK